MKIYSMTATFGKLENQTLTLQPGLNIIEAPNEWGKSTWCAFLVAMLYGIDTKARTTQTALADKERYAPWSGAPMEGRMDICWKGRDITIERRTKGRLIFGEFRAYETQTGVDVPELTATNCGTELLGVERSVFLRAGFLKMTDLPVTQDDALRRRLNSLVTTGDESGAGEKLGQTLKDLKNKCRYNRSGLLPQAEADAERLEEQIRSLQDINTQAQRLQERQQELENWVSQLQNHKAALAYAQAQSEAHHIEQAMSARDLAQEQLNRLTAICADLPSEEEAEQAKAKLQRLHNESMSLQMEQQMLPNPPQSPVAKTCFGDLLAQEAVEQTKKDAALAQACEKDKKRGNTLSLIGVIFFALALVLGVTAWLMPQFVMPLAIASAVPLVLSLVLVLLAGGKKKKATKILTQLAEKYESGEHTSWIAMAQEYAKTRQSFEEETIQYRQMQEQLQQRREQLVTQIEQLTGEKSIGACLESWEDIGEKWRALGDARRDYQRAQSQIEALKAVGKNVPAPQYPDELTHTLSETDALLQSAAFEQKQNQLRLGQYQGQAEALGQESALHSRLKQARSRIDALEDTYLALEFAQKALSAATSELQRRFAPRIAKRAQDLFTQLTDGRYRKIMLGEDLSLDISTEQETTLRSSQWRSDGTIDQVYLALRLAVAEELTPDAPLVLDDAMVRFDDSRLALALDILSQMADNKQVILFTCQGREKKLQGEKL